MIATNIMASAIDRHTSRVNRKPKEPTDPTGCLTSFMVKNEITKSRTKCTNYLFFLNQLQTLTLKNGEIRPSNQTITTNN